jgi:hypothetical protein
MGDRIDAVKTPFCINPGQARLKLRWFWDTLELTVNLSAYLHVFRKQDKKRDLVDELATGG